MSDQLYGEESHHLELRHSTVQWLGSNHHAMYSPLFDQSRPDNIPAYLARLSNPRSFAEIGDLHGLAWAEGLHIRVLTLEDVVELGPDDGSAPTITIACALSAQHYYSCRPLAVPQDPLVHVAEETGEFCAGLEPERSRSPRKTKEARKTRQPPSARTQLPRMRTFQQCPSRLNCTSLSNGVSSRTTLCTMN